jgi:hypothetical protein
MGVIAWIVLGLVRGPLNPARRSRGASAAPARRPAAGAQRRVCQDERPL